MSTPRIRVHDIRPVPSDDVRAAIILALESAWPSPAVTGGFTAADERWRFGSRPWHRPAIPVRRWAR